LLAAVDIDPLSRTKRHCFQAVTKDKVLRFCADSEAEVDRWLGGLVSLIEGGKGVGLGLGGDKGGPTAKGGAAALAKRASIQ
jgi:hypothetical protein